MSSPNAPFAPPDPAKLAPPPPPTYSAERRRRRWLPWVIVLGVVLLLGLAVAAIIGVATTIAASMSPAGEPLVIGESGPPTAAPLECPDRCFSESVIAATLIDDLELDALGITEHDFPWGTYDPTTADEAFRSTAAYWAGNDGAPDACVFALGDSPSVVDLVSDDGSADRIEYTGEHATSDINTTLEQTVRIFPDAASATGQMNTLYDQILDCPEISVGPRDERYTAEVTLAPALDLPAHVAGVGWVRTGDRGDRWRAYVFDLQIGNLVVRTRLMTDGSFSETDYRAFVEEYALRLEALEPAG